MEQGSAGLRAFFVLLPLVVSAAFVMGIAWSGRRAGLPAATVRRRTAVAGLLSAIWLAVTFAAAASGRLTFAGTPPTMMMLLLSMVGVALATGLSPVGSQLATHLPLAALVGVQGFRLPLELAMHRAYAEGLMPVEMSYSGFNFDIVTGASALVVAALLAAGRGPRWLVMGWNWVGVALLINVMTIALLTAPLSVRAFEASPPNVWVTQPPYVWLPSVLVLAALLGHILVFRSLRAAPARERGQAPALRTLA